MRILAIETSGRHGSVALLEHTADGISTVGEIRLDATQRRTAQALAPALADLLDGTAWLAKSIGFVSVAVGPGSFTGLRIGVTTAKTFAYAVGAQIVGINTLDVLAEQVPPSAAPVWTVLDAQRQELFAAKFIANESVDQPRTMVHETAIVAQDNWLARLRSGDYVTGPPLKKLAARLPAEVTAAPPSIWEPTAVSVGRVAWRLYRNGQRDDLWKLAPRYYRASAAEEKAARRRTI